MLIEKNYYYVIKLTYDNKSIFKLGEGNKDRPKKLLKKYMDRRAVQAELLHFSELPNNSIKRLTDKLIHKELLKNNYNQISKYEIIGVTGSDDGATEFFAYKTNKQSDTELIADIKNIILSIDPHSYTKKVKYIKNITLQYSQKQKHQVNFYYINELEKLGNCSLADCKDKIICLIGQFTPQYINRFAYRNIVYIWQDFGEKKPVYEDNRCNNNIKYIEDLETLIEMNKENKFDYILSNPPYEQGNKITKAILENVSFDTYVNLMPLAGYKGDKLFQHVSNMELIDPTLFEDANITDNLNIAILKSEKCNDLEWEDFEIESFNPKFKFAYDFIVKSRKNLFYQILPNMPNKYNVKENILHFDPKIDFMITTRTTHDGVHSSKDSWDIRWNIDKELVSTLSYMIRFPSIAAKENFCKFWYNKQLSQKLIKGLNKDSGNIYAAIPNIDWSHTDVEYTDEYVLEQMGLRWNENKDGVEKLQLNIHKENAKKALKQICNFLNFKCSSELIIDNDQNANHCKDINCGYLKTSPLAKQPCTCKNKKYIRLVNIAFNENDTDFYRLYYQLGHEIGHQYFDALGDNIFKDEILACYLSIVCVMKFIGGEKAKNYIQQCIQSSDNIYKFAMPIAYEAYVKWNGSIDKRFILSSIEILLKDKYIK